MDNKIEKALWEKAQEIAREKYDEELGWISAWEEADKYERQDRVWAEFEVLKKELKKSNNGNNKTTNTILNQKGNDTMENKKMTNAEERTMKLSQAGIDTSNFFNLNLQIPFGAEVKLVVDGKEVAVPVANGIGTSVPVTFNSPVIIDGATLLNDSIAQSIIDDGYVKNSKLFRRWITAHTFRMLDYKSYRNPRRTGWEACMKDRYAYGYQFEMMADELHTLAKLQKEDPEYFAERTIFFNGDVVVALLNDYLYRLKNYVKKQNRENPRKYRGEEYVKLAKYGNVLVKDLDDKVYIPIQERINVIESMVKAENYSYVEREFKIFMDKFYNKLPYDTTKCATWKDAFKGSGAYYTLQNLIRFHNVVLRGYTNKYDSEAKLNALLYGEYKNNVWKFHQLLVDTIAYNDFDLKKSIANGNAAPNTKSDKAENYIRRARNGR